MKCHGAQSHRKATGSHTSTVRSTQIGRSGSGRCRYEAFWHTHTHERVRNTGWMAWRQIVRRSSAVSLWLSASAWLCWLCQTVNDYIDYSSYTYKTMYDLSHFITKTSHFIKINIQCHELGFYFFFRSYLSRSFILQTVGAARLDPFQWTSWFNVVYIFVFLSFVISSHFWVSLTFDLYLLIIKYNIKEAEYEHCMSNSVTKQYS